MYLKERMYLGYQNQIREVCLHLRPQIEKKITSKTKVIMVVHLYGLPVDMDDVLNIARKHDLKVIEDAAEMSRHIKENLVVVLEI